MKTITYDETKWKLVPIEPTREQISAAQMAWLNDPCRLSSTLYRAMLAAAPVLTAQPQASVCPNCDTELPEGCGGLFRKDGDSCWLNLAQPQSKRGADADQA